MSLYSGKSFRKALRHFLLGRTAQAIAHFALILWLVRVLSPADYGVYMVLWGMVELMVPLSSLGMLEAVQRFLPDLASRGAPDALRKFVRWMTLIRLSIMLVWATIIAIYWVDIAVWMGFSEPQQEATFLAIGLIITVIGFRYASVMLECLLEQRWSQLTHALMPLGRLMGVGLLLIAGNLSLEYLLWVDLIVSLSCFLLAEFFLLRKLRCLSNTGDYRVGFREIAGFAWHMAGVNLLRASASAGALRILVARTLGLEAAGMFAFLQQLLKIVGRYLPANLLANLLRPMLISRYVAGETGIVSQGVALLWKSNLIIVAACIAVISIAGDTLIALASSNRFVDAGLITLIMLLSLGAASQGQLISLAMQIYSLTRQLRYFSLLTIMTPVAAYVGSYWGLVGVTIGIVLSIWLLNSLILWWLNQHAQRIDLDWFGVLRSIGLMVFIVLICWLIEREYGYVWALVMLLLAYGPGLILVKPLNQSDALLLNRALHRRARFLTPFVRKD